MLRYYYYMKRVIAFIMVILISAACLSAEETFYSGFSEAQKYDLADAYSKVADQYEKLGEKNKAADFREMAEVIFPGFSKASRPAVETTRPAEKNNTEKEKKPTADPAGREASRYYFNKLLRGVFNENISLTLSAVADTLYLPLYDDGISKSEAAEELQWFFSNYSLEGIAPSDVFDMSSIVIEPLENGFWRLTVSVYPEYSDALPIVTFWSERMGFYFRKYVQGWRLAAIGPAS